MAINHNARVRSALDKADSIVRTCWENFKATEPTYVLRDLIVVEITKAIEAERERCARMVDDLRAQWFHDGVPGDTAVPAGAFARSMTQLAAVMRDPNVNHVETD